MSLFYHDEEEELGQLVQSMSRQQYAQSPGLYDALPDRAKGFMKRDYYYAISYLKLAVDMKQAQIFLSYIRWTYQYLTHLMIYLPPEQVTAQIRDFYQAMIPCLPPELTPEQQQLARDYLNQAVEQIDRLSREGFGREPEFGSTPLYRQKIREYIALILRNDSKAALTFFVDLYHQGMGIEEIYLEVMQQIMLQIGQLWFENKITVAQEHYCTALTQTAIAQLYDVIFATPSNGRTMVGCCMGGELHEMGMRTITDLLAYEGWNSIFLGAGVPEESLLSTVEREKPQLVALSVTMPQNLPLCRQVLADLRKNQPAVKIAVGGRGFDDVPGLWQGWGADVYTTNARELIAWVRTNIK